MTNLGGTAVASFEISTGPDAGKAAEAAAELEELGFSALWLPGAQGNNLERIAHVVRSTSRITVGSGILSVLQAGADEVLATQAELEKEHPGRFVAGLGGAHGPRPFATLTTYLDALDHEGLPADQRVLSALGPKMLGLARDRTAGAYPFLVTPEYTASARETLGSAKLVVLLKVVPEADPSTAREAARKSLAFLATRPPYAANFARMGFTDDDVARLSDRLVDGVTIWGGFDRIVEGVLAHRAAGADQVVLQLEGIPHEWYPRLAEALA